MQCLVVLMAALLVQTSSGSGSGSVPLSGENRIIGGSEADIRRVPWQVSLQGHDVHFCGGAIISSRWILTAAHCLEYVTAEHLRIRLGSNSSLEGGTLYKVLKVVVHEKYDEVSVLNDIGALMTTTVIEFGPSVSKVALPGEGEGVRRPPVGATLRISGWGNMEGHQKPTLLRVVDIELVHFSVCKRYYFDTDRESQLCAGSSDKKICHADSGGPLVWGDVLVGLASYSDTFCSSPADGFTDVTFYRPWIKAHTAV